MELCLKKEESIKKHHKTVNKCEVFANSVEIEKNICYNRKIGSLHFENVSYDRNANGVPELNQNGWFED